MLDVATPLNRKAKFSFGGGYGRLRDKYYQSRNVDFVTTKEDQSDYSLFKVNAGVDWNKITQRDYPTKGYRQIVAAMFVTGHDKYKNPNIVPSAFVKSTTTWFEGKASSEIYFDKWKKFIFGTYAEILASNKKFYSNYTATILQAPAFTPTFHSQLVFRDAFRAMNYLAVGVKTNMENK